MSSDDFAHDSDTMEKPQEMQQIDTSKKVGTNSKSAEFMALTPQAIPNSRSKKVLHISSESEDDLNLFDEDTTPALMALQVNDTATSQRLAKGFPHKRTTDSDSSDQLEKELHQLQRDYENARRDLKSVNRENRDQSLELRDLKRANAQASGKNAQLRENNNQLRDALRTRGDKFSKSERTKYIEHFELLEDHISHLQYEKQKGEAHMEFLTEQTREANEEKSSIAAESRKLQRQVRDLSNNLTECKDDLLRLQPTSQVSDNEISDQYSNLDQQISGWVDDKTEDSQILEDNIANVKSSEDMPDLFREYVSSDNLRMVQKYPESQPILLRYLIHCYLNTFIFNNDIYLFGLDARNIALLQGLEEGMKLLEPRRDEVTVRRWRSETLQSLLKMENFIKEQERQAKLVSQTLQSALSSLVSESSDDGSGWEDVHMEIVLPAIQLATKLRLSTADYRLISHIFAKDPARTAAVFVYEIKDSSMIDIITHKVIRPDSVLKVAHDGRIGEEMLIVSPALLRIQKDGKGKVLICKPTILVKLDEPMGKRSRGIKALGAWTPSWFGGDDAAK